MLQVSAGYQNFDYWVINSVLGNNAPTSVVYLIRISSNAAVVTKPTVAKPEPSSKLDRYRSN